MLESLIQSKSPGQNSVLEGKATTGREIDMVKIVRNLAEKKNISEDSAKKILLDLTENNWLDETDVEKYSLQTQGAIDSMSQYSRKDLDFDENRAKLVLQSKDIVEEYNMYLNYEYDRILKYNSEKSGKSPLTETILSYHESLVDNGVAPSDIKKYLMESFFEVSNNPTVIKKFLNLRLNYNKRMIQLMEKMLRNNYQLLGLTDKEVEMKISESHGKSFTDKKIDMVELIRKNQNKFIKGKDFVDLRDIGFGVFIRTKEDMYSLEKYVKWENHIQQLMRYDAVVVVHGGSRSEVDVHFDEYEKYFDDAYSKFSDTMDKLLYKKNKVVNDAKAFSQEFNDAFSGASMRMYRIYARVATRFINPTIFMGNIESDLKSRSQDLADYALNLYFTKDDFINICAYDYTSHIRDIEIDLDIDTLCPKYDNESTEAIQSALSSINANPEAKKLFEKMKSRMLEIDKQLYTVYSDIVDELNHTAFDLPKKYKDAAFSLKTGRHYGRRIWSCQELVTPGGFKTKDVNDFLRHVIKEGFKSIYLSCCNPGRHDIDDDILAMKGVHIHRATNTLIAESTESNTDWYTISETSLNDTEDHLYQVATENGINYYDDNYLVECMESELNNEFVQENILKDAWDSAGKVAKKVLVAIVGFFKAIINFVRNVINKIREKLKGKPKDNFEKTVSPVIVIESAKVTEKEVSSYAELEKNVTSACAKISQKIQQLDQKQTTITQQIIKQCEKNVKEESMESNMYTDGNVVLEGKESHGRELDGIAVIHNLAEKKSISEESAAKILNALLANGQFSEEDVPKISTMSKGAIDHMQQFPQKGIEFDERRAKAVLKSKDIVAEYNAYLNYELDKIEKFVSGGGASNLGKLILNDHLVLTQQLGVDEGDVKKYLLETYFEVSNNPTTIKKFLNLRLNYNKRMIQIMEEMLRNNYKQLGLSDIAAQMKIASLHLRSFEHNKIDMVDLIRKNQSKFIKGKGLVDLREIGFGCFVRTEENIGEHWEKIGTWDHYIQQLMRYDAVIVAHGGSGGEDVRTVSTPLERMVHNLQPYTDVIQGFQSEVNDITADSDKIDDKYDAIIDSLDDGDVASNVNNIRSVFDDISIMRALNKWVKDNREFLTYIEGIPMIHNYGILFKEGYKFEKMTRVPTSHSDMVNLIKKYEDDENFVDKLKNDKDHRDVYNKALNIAYEHYIKFTELYNKIIDAFNKGIDSVPEEDRKILLSYGKGEYKHDDPTWFVQPITTPGGFKTTDVNEFLRHMIKEGFKSIYFIPCNPGHHKIAEDITKMKGVNIHYSTNSTLIETTATIDTHMDWISVAETALNDTEDHLYQVSMESDIDYYDDDYLMECMNTDFDKEYIQENILKDAWDTAVKIAKKVLAAIIGFFKAIVNFVRSVIAKIKEKLKGKPNDKFPKTPTSAIVIEAAKVIETEVQSYDELERTITSACAKIAQKIRALDQKQTTITQQIVKQCEKNVKEDSMESYTYKGKELSDSVLEDFLFLELVKNDIPYRDGMIMESSSIRSLLEDGGFCPNQRNLNEITPMDRYPVDTAEDGVKSTISLFEDILAADTDEEITECMLTFGKLNFDINQRYSVLEGTDLVIEGIGSSSREAIRKGREGVRSTTRKVGKAISSANTSVNKVLDPMEKFINASMEKIQKADAAERRDVILRGGIIPKITRWIKRGIAIIAGLTVGQAIPVAAIISGIAFIGWIATDKWMDVKEKERILRELDDEIEIVNEKIDDSRSDSNRQKKYELMRIRNKLKRTADKVRYNLRAPAEEDIIHSNSKK